MTQIISFVNQKGGVGKTTKAISIGDFQKYAFPLVRAIFPELVANQLVSVQPMLGPVSQVFYLDFVYGTTKGNVLRGQKVFDSIGLGPNNPYYSSPLVEGEVLGTGTGAQPNFQQNLSYTPVRAGSVAITDGSSTITDDGNGNLLYDVPNPVISVPPALTNVPGMKNLNTGNPGDLVQTLIGTVNYVTGLFTFNLPSGVSVAAGQLLRIFVSQYTTGRPYSLLFWNNEITIRPVPKYTHKVEVETYLTPVQFMSYSDNPIMNQWAKYIAYGAAIDILTDRQDIDGVNNLMDAFKYEEGLVLERQGAEEIGQRNATIFSSSVQGNGNYWGAWGNWY